MKALVLFSGGVDSTTCLGMAIDKYGKDNVIALSISYGQKHTKEIEASNKIVEYYGVEHISLDLEKIFEYSDCSLLSHSDVDIPKESYAKQLEKTDGKPVSTYVPFRNGLFLSTAASIALSKDCGVIYYGNAVCEQRTWKHIYLRFHGRYAYQAVPYVSFRCHCHCRINFLQPELRCRQSETN